MSAIDDVLAAFGQVGWRVTKQERVCKGRSPNPTRVDLARGQRRLSLLAYAWKLVLEGKGRSGRNYRVEVTRCHEGDLLMEAGRVTVGFGVDADRQVLAVFDGWTKRATGKSSSVHIRRVTLDKAAAEGYAEEDPRWDGRAAVRTAEADRLLDWIATQSQTRLTFVQPLDYTITGEKAIITADLWDAAPAAWLRRRDKLVLASKSLTTLLDTSFWEVQDVEVRVITKTGRNPRRSVTFNCRRFGRVRQNQADFLKSLGGTPTT